MTTMLVATGPCNSTSSTGSAIVPKTAMINCAGSEPAPAEAIAAPRKASQAVGRNMPRKVERNTWPSDSVVWVNRV
ncbi:hypothetical protein D3C84_1242590 [compost metagenome]